MTSDSGDSLADKRALVVSYSNIFSDPRVRRQIDWLAVEGYTVDILGTKGEPVPGVEKQFTFLPAAKWTNTKLGYALTGSLLPRKLGFKHKMLKSVPKEALDAIRAGEYELIVLNELQLVPIVSFPDLVGKKGTGPHIHIDLHEKQRQDRLRDDLGARIAAPLYKWSYRQLGNRRIDSRSVVNEQIGQMYADELSISPPIPVRNTPFFKELSPSPVDPKVIRLVHHGIASHHRGFREMLDAMALLPARFTLDFMLTPNQVVHTWLAEQIARNPAANRIRIVPPAPMTEIPERINPYDLEIIYLPPVSDSIKNALPNKFFEAIQGRLGLVVGEGATMAPLVREWGNGIVVPGHSGEALAKALSEITASDVERFKEASEEAAKYLNAEAEGAAFLSAIETPLASY